MASAPENGETPPSTLYLEGTAISTNANVTLTYTWAGQSVSQVRKMVVLGEGFDSQMVDGCDLYLIPYVDDKPHFGPVCKDQRVTFKVVDCRTEEETTQPPDPPAPCTVQCWPPSCGSLAAGYRIQDYSNTYFDVCSACVDWTGTPPWNGGFEKLDEIPGFWQSTEGTEVNGKNFGGAVLSLNTTQCRWELHIQCMGDFGMTETLWLGYKAMGDSPAGSYNRVSGCDTTGSLEIEEIAECELDCTPCPGSITAKLSGFVGTGAYGCSDCTNANGSYTLTGSSCSYSWGGYNGCVGFIALSGGCDGWICEVHGPSAPQLALFEAPGSQCPPECGWTPTQYYDNCTDGSLTLDVDGDGIFGEDPGSGGGPDPAHENDATVTELIVNGGSNVSGTSASSERTATASTPGENQLSAQATVEWDGETHTKTVQLTVVEITGIEWSQDGGSTWTALPKDEPEDGDFVESSARALTTKFRTRTVPADVDEPVANPWDLAGRAGYLVSSTGGSAEFVYDHVTPYTSDTVGDVIIHPPGCQSRPATFTFFKLYSHTCAVVEGETETDSNLQSYPKALKNLPHGKLREHIAALFPKSPRFKEGEMGFKKVADADISLYGFRGNTNRFAKELWPQKVSRIDNYKRVFTRIDVGIVGTPGTKEYRMALRYHAASSQLVTIGGDTVLRTPLGEYFLVPLRKDQELKYRRNPEKVHDRLEAHHFHVFVVDFGIDSANDGKLDDPEDDYELFLPGNSIQEGVSEEKGRPYVTREDAFRHGPFKGVRGPFGQPVLLIWKGMGTDYGVVRVKFEITTPTQLPGYCENGVFPKGRSDTDDFSFRVLANGRSLSVGSEGVPKVSDWRTAEAGKVESEIVWARLWCKDYGGSFVLKTTVTLANNETFELPLRPIPVDTDADGLPDVWELERVREWNLKRVDPNDVAAANDTKLLELIAKEQGSAIIAQKQVVPGKELTCFDSKSDDEPAEFEVYMPTPYVGAKVIKDYKVWPVDKYAAKVKHLSKGDGLTAQEEYRGYIFDGGGASDELPNGQKGHVRLSTIAKEALIEADIGDAPVEWVEGRSSPIRAGLVNQILTRVSSDFIARGSGAGVRVYWKIDAYHLISHPSKSQLRKLGQSKAYQEFLNSSRNRRFQKFYHLFFVDKELSADGDHPTIGARFFSKAGVMVYLADIPKTRENSIALTELYLPTPPTADSKPPKKLQILNGKRAPSLFAVAARFVARELTKSFTTPPPRKTRRHVDFTIDNAYVPLPMWNSGMGTQYPAASVDVGFRHAGRWYLDWGLGYEDLCDSRNLVYYLSEPDQDYCFASDGLGQVGVLS